MEGGAGNVPWAQFSPLVQAVCRACLGEVTGVRVVWIHTLQVLRGYLPLKQSLNDEDCFVSRPAYENHRLARLWGLAPPITDKPLAAPHAGSTSRSRGTAPFSQFANLQAPSSCRIFHRDVVALFNRSEWIQHLSIRNGWLYCKPQRLIRPQDRAIPPR